MGAVLAPLSPAAPPSPSRGLSPAPCPGCVQLCAACQAGLLVAWGPGAGRGASRGGESSAVCRGGAGAAPGGGPSSPAELPRAVLVDEGLVVPPQLLHRGQLLLLGVEVELAVGASRGSEPNGGGGAQRPSPPPQLLDHALELLDPGQHAQVLLAAEVPVVPVRVPGVEGVEANHVEGLGGVGGRWGQGCDMGGAVGARPPTLHPQPSPPWAGRSC